MGHRANFVVIRDGAAEAYYDDWAALGCIHCVKDGPDDAAKLASDFEPTDELLDWAFMEGGYLIDFDEKTLIVFGMTEDDLGGEFAFDDEDDEGIGNDDQAEDEAAAEDPDDEWNEEGEDEFDKEAERAAAVAFLEGIAPHWKGWTLRWDQRGADAFAEHLAHRSIRSLKTQPASAEECLMVELQA